jgi:prepilin-type N-terminal cleavage/methylation domain-containing protein
MLSNGRTIRSGFGLVELLISLAITALVLTATAMAFQSALQANEANMELHDAVVAARNTMEYVLRVCRTAESLSVQEGTPYAGDDINVTTGPTLVVELAAPDGAESGDLVALRWDESAENTPLRYYRNLDTTPVVSTMLPSLEGLTFEREIDQAIGGELYTSRVIVTVTVRAGEALYTMSGSVAPRKVLKASEDAGG